MHVSQFAFALVAFVNTNYLQMMHVNIIIIMLHVAIIYLAWRGADACHYSIQNGIYFGKSIIRSHFTTFQELFPSIESVFNVHTL